ncbi:MAG: sigma-70 family RNA polymerase sigma factor [Planctomycetes bacterium]|nr:sigma-70 family RNA polymerase sigma factor [Planctomycetota bacterium]
MQKPDFAPRVRKPPWYARPDHIRMDSSPDTPDSSAQDAVLPAWGSAANSEAEEALHRELRSIARAILKGRACPGLLQTTALVHEAWMRLKGFDLSRWDSRSSRFAALASKTLRSVLVDEARRESRDKRGGDWRRLRLSSSEIETPRQRESVDLLSLDDALKDLAAVHAREATVVELRFFGGFTIEQIAEHMGFSTRTIETDWEHARAWLRVRLDGLSAGD